MDKDDRISIKLPRDVHRLLRLVSAQTGEKQYGTLHRLLSREWERLQREMATKESR